MNSSFQTELTTAIANAARQAFRELFANGEHYYYCTLITIAEGYAPFASAWSVEALEHATAQNPDDDVKWSYADSPYDIVGEAYFEPVQQLLDTRPRIEEVSQEEWEAELLLRLEAMEQAMRQLDVEGLFAENQPREQICIMAELMPPVPLNTTIAKRLNPPEALAAWLVEVAEPEHPES